MAFNSVSSYDLENLFMKCSGWFELGHDHVAQDEMGVVCLQDVGDFHFSILLDVCIALTGLEHAGCRTLPAAGPVDRGAADRRRNELLIARCFERIHLPPEMLG